MKYSIIDIIYSSIDSLEDSKFGYYLNFLPAKMQQEILRYRNIETKKAKLLARLMLLDQLNSTDSGYSLNNWELSETNKPFINNWNHFNFSHSGKLVMLCHSIYPVGIDIEFMEEIDYKSISKYFTSHERKFITNSITPIKAFYEIWVKKEALFKTLGVGLSMSLDSCSCLNELIEFKQSTFFFKQLKIHPDYMSFLCTPVSNYSSRLKVFELQKSSLDGRCYRD